MGIIQQRTLLLHRREKNGNYGSHGNYVEPSAPRKKATSQENRKLKFKKGQFLQNGMKQQFPQTTKTAVFLKDHCTKCKTAASPFGAEGSTSFPSFP